MVNTKEIVYAGVGAAAGAGEVLVLRKYVDEKYPTLIEQLGSYGKPSALIPIATGLPVAIIGTMGMFGRGPTARKDYNTALVAYGISATVGGIASAMTPAAARVRRVVPVAPTAVPVGAEEKKPAPVATGRFVVE